MITNYKEEERQPPNSRFYSKSLIIGFRDTFSLEATFKILNNLDSSAFSVRFGLSHCKRILKVPDSSSSTSGIILYFDYPYKLVYESLKKLDREIKFTIIEHPTNQLNLTSTSTTTYQP